ncbi:MAG TPA: C25 family cysteine peptidase [Candidatus Thermoplasmatota archaeon]|nr:C25 family cysteine peptidase [Candidatus Thermoplasmatota archaeon]
MNKKCHHLSIILLIFLLISSSQQIFASQSISEGTNEYEFIIISPSAFTDALQPLISHKNDNEISTKLVTVEELYSGDWPVSNPMIGRDDAETIKFFLRESVKQWNTEYVMLVGGKEEVPVRYARINTNSSSSHPQLLPYFFQGLPDLMQMMDQYISDLYYADLFFENGSFCSWDTNNNMQFAEKNEVEQIDLVDIYPDVAVGRVLCTSVDEVNIVVNKIINYETDQNPDATWKKKVTVCGGDTHSLWRDLLIKIGYPTEYEADIAWEGEYMGDKVTEILNEYDATKVYTTKLSHENRMFVSRENINSAINEGCNFLFMAGHGYPQAWGTHPPSVFGKIWLPGPIINPLLYRVEDVKQLSNQEKLPVAVISACSCGDFNDTNDPIAWKFVEHEHGGSIASFACSTLGTLLPTTLSEKTLNGKLALGVFNAYKDGNKRVGDLWVESIDRYVDDPVAMDLGSFGGVFWLNQFNLEEWILFGDPTLEIN